MTEALLPGELKWNICYPTLADAKRPACPWSNMRNLSSRPVTYEQGLDDEKYWLGGEKAGRIDLQT